eukprot:TRINITY_DN3305_c0_g2_i1.p1 TRINITY_DN3305_c0_g2~~TRINITY_DN3305_c0_g2_i1.p1  ORF type:complete len:668 (+),score=124.67 TRINITY_DN3305_c0_g2_i1:86-2089(+)
MAAQKENFEFNVWGRTVAVTAAWAFGAAGVPLFFYREFPAWHLIPYCWGMAILLGVLFYPFESLASRGGYFAPVRIFWINGIFLLGASVFPFFQAPTIFVGMVVAFAGILYIVAAARGEKVIVPPAARGPPPAASRKPQDTRPVSERLNAYLVNEGVALLVVALFLLANGAVFVERFLYYMRVRQDFFPILGYGLTIARACGAGLKLTGSVILITMCRNFLSRVRETFVGTYLPVLDKHIDWHKAIAWIIAIYATAHTMAHAVNFQNLSLLDLETLKAINVATPDITERPTLVRLWWGTVPGFTGHVVLTCMVLMYSTAVSSVRRHKKMFELFWFSHHLFIVFFVALCIHGAQGVLEPANFWMWWAGPGLLYLMERVTRGVRKNQDTIILQAIAHKSQVLELRMRKANLQWRPGQYVFLNCPYIASNEWHPFTISSSPDENYLSVHIKRAGDWTGALHDLINPEKKMDGSVVRESLVLDPSGKPIISIDGPFGAASEDVFKFENVVLSAAGIGITPMASILKAIRYQIQNHPESCPIRRVNFYWSNQDVESFEWILHLLAELEETCPFLTSQLFVTRMAGDEADIIRNIIYAETEGVDAFLGLKRTRLNRTRPNFDKIFKESAENEFKDEEVGVFFCGAPAVANDIYKACIKHSKKRTKFIFHKENF